jgi:hypothetical protein
MAAGANWAGLQYLFRTSATDFKSAVRNLVYGHPASANRYHSVAERCGIASVGGRGGGSAALAVRQSIGSVSFCLLLIQKAIHRAPAHRPGCGRLQRECLKLLREHERNGDIPTHGRFLFYELEQRGVIAKKYAGVNPRTGKNYARTPLQDVSVATVHLREVGLVPWHWIEDESLWSYAASVADYVRAAIDRH